MGNDLPNEEETVNHINFLPEFNFLQQQQQQKFMESLSALIMDSTRNYLGYLC